MVQIAKVYSCVFAAKEDLLREKEKPAKNPLVFTRESKCELLELPELEIAEQEIIKFNQKIALTEEIEALKKGKSVKKSSALITLDPIMVQGLLRVGGRLRIATLSEDSQHQIIIPRDSHLARLLVFRFHEKSGHSGREYVSFALLREKFWLIRAIPL